MNNNIRLKRQLQMLVNVGYQILLILHSLTAPFISYIKISVKIIGEFIILERLELCGH